MRGTTRYILRQIAGPFLFVALTLTGVIWLTQSLRFIERIVNQGLPLQSFLHITLLLLPGVLLIILPVALFCAVLWVYHRLAGESELVVLWAAGFSRADLAKPALLMALVTMAACYALGLYAAPLGARNVRNMQYELTSGLASMVLQEGTFNTPRSGLTVYVRERDPDGEMLGILVHDNRDPARPITMMAERGALVATAQGPRFVMAHGNRQQIDREQGQLSLLYFDSYTLDLSLYASGGGQAWREPGERFIGELFWPDLGNADDVANYRRLVVEGHRRLAMPLFVPALVLVALAGVLAGEYSRRGKSHRLAFAAVAAIALQVIGLAVVHLAGKTPGLVPLLYANPLAFAAGAIYMLRDRRLRRPAPAVAGAEG
jgi:lipopolysaccharide export system permease protein